jgi:hypothetical protein
MTEMDARDLMMAGPPAGRSQDHVGFSMATRHLPALKIFDGNKRCVHDF